MKIDLQPIRAAIVAALGEGPATTDALRAAVHRAGASASEQTVRRVCERLQAEGALVSTRVRTRKIRKGVVLWSRAGEDEAKVGAAIEALRAQPQRFAAYRGAA